jgi:hypothetical protein
MRFLTIDLFANTNIVGAGAAVGKRHCRFRAARLSIEMRRSSRPLAATRAVSLLAPDLFHGAVQVLAFIGICYHSAAVAPLRHLTDKARARRLVGGELTLKNATTARSQRGEAGRKTARDAVKHGLNLIWIK